MAKTKAKETATGALSKAFAKRLKEANAAWTGAKEKAREGKAFSEIDDGRYTARITNVKIGESGAGRLQSIWTFKIEDDDKNGSATGMEKLDFMGLENEQNLEFFGRRLVQLGYEMPDDLSEVVDIFTDISSSKPLCKVRVKTKGEFQNVYIDKIFASDDADDDEDSGDDGGAPPAPEEEEEAEAEEAEEAEEEVELTVGASVTATTADGDRTGTVLEILEKEGKVRVKMDDNGKVLRVALDKIAMNADEEETEEEEEEEEEVPVEPAKKPGKKTKK